MFTAPRIAALKRSRACVATFGSLAAVLAGLGVASPAQALHQNVGPFQINQLLVGGGDDVSYPEAHTYDYNVVYYGGRGNVTVCSRLHGFGSGAVYAHACGVNLALARMPNNLDVGVRTVAGNRSPNNHTLAWVGQY